MNIILFPFAGGNFGSFRAFQELLRQMGHEVHVVDYPGHGRRLAEPLLQNLPAIAEDCLRFYGSRMQTPYRLFGHSMGALVAYWVLRHAQESGLPLPEKLVVSGKASPCTDIPHDPPHVLPKEGLIKYLGALGGVSAELLNEPDFFDYYEPIIRADMEAVFTCKPQSPQPLPVPCKALMGTKERFSQEECRNWERFTDQEFIFQQFEGGHFFIDEYPREVVEMILS